MNIEVYKNTFNLKKVFAISRGSKTKAEVVTVKINKNGIVGMGECVPYKRYNETIESVLIQIKNIQAFNNRDELQNLLPPGAARNALDCAMWDLEAKTNHSTVFKISNLPKPKPVITAYTLSLSTPNKMADEAKLNSEKPILKIKLGGGHIDLERVEAVKKNAPNSKLIVDANESWTINDFIEIEPKFLKLGVNMIEQPFKVSIDSHLLNINNNIPICADESCHTSSDLKNCLGKYDIINIKLDKTGGLTEAIKLKTNALKKNFEIMIGCMIGSSLSMAPAVLLSQNVSWVDLDGPLLLAEDRENPIRFNNNYIYPSNSQLWG